MGRPLALGHSSPGGPPDRGLLDPPEQVVDIDPLPPAVAARLVGVPHADADLAAPMGRHREAGLVARRGGIMGECRP
mgnify:CR=1 FL=1